MNYSQITTSEDCTHILDKYYVSDINVKYFKQNKMLLIINGLLQFCH